MGFLMGVEVGKNLFFQRGTWGASGRGVKTALNAAYYGQLSENTIIVIVAEIAKVVIQLVPLLCVLFYFLFILRLIVFHKFHWYMRFYKRVFHALADQQS